MHTQPTRPRRSRRWRTPAAAVSTVLAVSAAGLSPASATLVPEEPIADGRNITVFHNIDFVVAAGWPVGETITVEVLRNGVVVGSATGPSVDTVEGSALEVNHGPEGTPAPGECWDGHTPDVRPGDTVRVRHGDTRSSVVVDDITFSGPAYEVSPPPGETNGTIEVRGVARYADGTPIPLDRLDSSGFRDGQLRGVPDEVVVDDAVDGGFVMRYHPPYDLQRNPGLDLAQRKASLLNSGGHATGFGHTEEVPAESMLVDGIDDVPGPADGCQGSPAAVDAVGGTSHAVINQAVAASDDPLRVTGSSFDATEVKISVGNLTQTVEQTVEPTPVAARPRHQTWEASFAMAEVAALPDGELTVSMEVRVEGVWMQGKGRTLVKDTVAPPTPSANPVAGTHQGTQLVSLFSEEGARLFYALNDGLQTPYTREISISEVRTNTLTAFAQDAAGNRSAPFTGSYTITSPPPPASGGGGGGGGGGTAPPPAPAPAPQPVTAPGAPGIGGVTAGRGSASVSWTAPVENGGAPITGYRLQVLRDGTVARTISLGAGVTKVSVDRLVNGARYRFAVSAVNEAGEGARSPLSDVVRPQAVPSVVRKVRALANEPGGPVTATVTWVQPRSNGGSRITGYLVRAHKVRTDGSLGRSRLVADLASTARAVTVKLAPASYRFTVRAVNGVGRGEWSALSNRRLAR